MSKSCMSCKHFEYKRGKDGKVWFWGKGNCSLDKREVFDAALCKNYIKNGGVK